MSSFRRPELLPTNSHTRVKEQRSFGMKSRLPLYKLTCKKCGGEFLTAIRARSHHAHTLRRGQRIPNPAMPGLFGIIRCAQRSSHGNCRFRYSVRLPVFVVQSSVFSVGIGADGAGILVQPRMVNKAIPCD